MDNRLNKDNISITILFIGVFIFSSCQEFLPPRDNPSDYFSFETSVVYDIFQPNNSAVRRNQLLVLLRIANNFDETIQDKVNVDGTISISWLPPEGLPYPSVLERTFTLKNDNIIRAKGYDRSTGILTIDAKDTIVLMCSWNFKTDDSTYLYKYFPYIFDTHCVVKDEDGQQRFRKVTDTQKFKVTAAVKLSDRTSSLYFKPIEFEKCFIFPYVNEVVNPFDPCRQLSGFTDDYCKLVK